MNFVVKTLESNFLYALNITNWGLTYLTPNRHTCTTYRKSDANMKVN